MDLSKASDNHSPKDLVKHEDLLEKILRKAPDGNTAWQLF